MNIADIWHRSHELARHGIGRHLQLRPGRGLLPGGRPGLLRRAGHGRAHHRQRRAARRAGGCSPAVRAMGVGIWSMHFIGMLAFKLPIPQGYDLAITLLLAADRRGLLRLTRCGWSRSRRLPHLRLLGGALILGARHRRHALHRHGGDAHAAGSSTTSRCCSSSPSSSPSSPAGAALWIAHHLRAKAARIRRIRAAGGAGHGLCRRRHALHRHGRRALPAGQHLRRGLGNGVSPQWLASLVGISSFAILALAIVVSDPGPRCRRAPPGCPSRCRGQRGTDLPRAARHAHRACPTACCWRTDSARPWKRPQRSQIAFRPDVPGSGRIQGRSTTPMAIRSAICCWSQVAKRHPRRSPRPGHASPVWAATNSCC